MKKAVRNILHNADKKTVCHIAEKYKAADSNTADRIYNKALSRMNLQSDSLEVSGTNIVRRSPAIQRFFLVAACVLVVFGAVIGIMKLKAPKRRPIIDNPVIIATATTATQTTDKTTTVTVSGEEKVSKTTVNRSTSTTSSRSTVTTSHTSAVRNSNTTTAKQDKNKNTTTTEKRMTEQEIIEFERNNYASCMSRERAILKGIIPADTPRVTLDQVRRIISESLSCREIEAKIKAINKYEDLTAFYGTEYWLDGSRNRIIYITDNYMAVENNGGGMITYITSTNGDPYSDSAKKEILFSTAEKLKNIPESHQRERMIVEGFGNYEAPRVSADEARAICSKYTRFFDASNEIKNRYYYPDRLYKNVLEVCEYWLDDKGKDILLINYDIGCIQLIFNADTDSLRREILMQNNAVFGETPESVVFTHHEALIRGKTSNDIERLYYSDIKKLAAGCSTTDELAEKIRKEYRYADITTTSADGTRKEYFALRSPMAYNVDFLILSDNEEYGIEYLEIGSNIRERFNPGTRQFEAVF